MPLLKNGTFEKASIPEHLRDEDEVFYCSISDEIFRDYEEFSERMLLYNSVVWTCSMTGRGNLTYQEALDSEKKAQASLQDFPTELKIPVLYIANRTKRLNFKDMSNDIYSYVKDRYFIGEKVQTCFAGNKWIDSYVLHVRAPSEEEINNFPKNGEKHVYPPSLLYKYEIEHLDTRNDDISEIMVASQNQIRRKAHSFSKEVCKLFLKQCVQQDETGQFVLKSTQMETYKLANVDFNQIFSGPPPIFDVSKRIANGKKTRQESLHKYFSKCNNGSTNESNTALLEKMKKREEEFKLLKQKKIEEKLVLKQKKKEMNVVIAGHMKEWYKPKEDLELENQSKLPDSIPIKCNVPEEHFGDMLMILEFVTSFSSLLTSKDFFPGGLTFDVMERALTKNEVAGPFIDLIQMFLNALFNMQEEEACQYKTSVETASSAKEDGSAPKNLNLHQGTRLATSAHSWSERHHGIPLSKLPLYSLTTSEILRLHLLGSGANINYTGSKWRYQQRGGYTSEDDPGLHLRLHRPHILKSLALHNVSQLTMFDKLEILSCLMNQLLTYADVRDIIDERIENNRQAKTQFKTNLAAERKREQEFQANTIKLKKEMKDEKETLLAQLNTLQVQADKKKAELEYKLEECAKQLHVQQIVMGEDRAFRQYIKLDSVPGIFVNAEASSAGSCLNAIVKQIPALVEADRKVIAAHLQNKLKETTGSDKENSPTKSPTKGNTTRNSLSESTDNCDDLMMCSANPSTCVVHSANSTKNRWGFYNDIDTINQLINNLNKRGLRESELQQTLTNTKEVIENILEKTPTSRLNIDMSSAADVDKSTNKKARYEDANLGYPDEMSTDEILHNALTENILEMEEKLFGGDLGRLRVKDRTVWRNVIQNKNYKELDTTITRKGDSPDQTDIKESKDPGQLLGFTKDQTIADQSKDTITAIHSLAIALTQVAHSVEKKYFKAPLGRMGKNKNNKLKENMLHKWERSLLGSTSFSQVFLHYSTLDSCVMWGRSALLARCRICRRQNDSENMLLCDLCNLGHHLYCLKPKLKSVPAGDWFCQKCLKQKAQEAKQNILELSPPKKRPIFRDEEIDEEDEDELRSNEEKEEIDVDDDCAEESKEDLQIKVELCKTCGSGGELISCDKCLLNYHIECVEPPLRRAPRGPWSCGGCKRITERKRSHDSDEEEIINKRSSRREEGRSDLPLHNAALHEVLSEIMKDTNAWPFLKPVSKNEVPDYYEVITKPMDFGTIKYKLNMGVYTQDAHFMSDAVLVFQNCNTYNQTHDDVYKCGVQLLKHFQKKCRELGLKLPEEMDYNNCTIRPKKKQRTK